MLPVIAGVIGVGVGTYLYNETKSDYSSSVNNYYNEVDRQEKEIKRKAKNTKRRYELDKLYKVKKCVKEKIAMVSILKLICKRELQR